MRCSCAARSGWPATGGNGLGGIGSQSSRAPSRLRACLGPDTVGSGDDTGTSPIPHARSARWHGTVGRDGLRFGPMGDAPPIVRARRSAFAAAFLSLPLPRARTCLPRPLAARPGVGGPAHPRDRRRRRAHPELAGQDGPAGPAPRPRDEHRGLRRHHHRPALPARRGRGCLPARARPEGRLERQPDALDGGPARHRPRPHREPRRGRAPGLVRLRHDHRHHRQQRRRQRAARLPRTSRPSASRSRTPRSRRRRRSRPKTRAPLRTRARPDARPHPPGPDGTARRA